MLDQVTEASFRTLVLAAPEPVLVLFTSRDCAASAALSQALAARCAAHSPRVGAVRVDVDEASDLAGLYMVEATPTLLVFSYGEPITRVVGFVPGALLDLLVEQVAQRALPRGLYWSPLETLVEDSMILPLLDRAGLHYQRQVSCALGPGDPRARGRIDLLVSPAPKTPPFMLIESKRRLLTRADLRRATEQALGYATALQLAAFAVAAPPGLWLFRRVGERAALLRELTSLIIEREPEQVVAALRRLEQEGC